MQPQHAARNIAQPECAACNLVHPQRATHPHAPHNDNNAPTRSRATKHAPSALMCSRAKTT
eukprot:5063170-Alexandrium_andersonii.AAC.1